MSLSQNNLNWNEVTSLLQKHSVVGQFCTVMAKHGWPNVPIEKAERLKQLRIAQVAQALGQVAELARVGVSFTEAGVALIPLKGVGLSQELYGNPCVRSSCDLDIMVMPEDVLRCEELLTRLGYRHAAGYSNTLGFHEMSERQKCHIIDTLHHHEYVNDASGMHIELHWRGYLWSDEQVAALWASSAPLSWLDCGLRQLSKEDTILFLLDHGARHGWSCLKWLSDVAMLLENLSEDAWRSLYNRAVFFDLQRVVTQTVTLLGWFYGINPPLHVKELVRTDSVVRKISLQAASQLLASSNKVSIFERKFPGISLSVRIKTLKPATPVTTLLKRTLITYDDFDLCRLPDCLFWLYAVMRPYYWFKRRCMKR
ncbi:MAG: nucleotidyltransferase domain-containing protein [Desulfuromonadaceae bacterium]